MANSIIHFLITFSSSSSRWHSRVFIGLLVLHYLTYLLTYLVYFHVGLPLYSGELAGLANSIPFPCHRSVHHKRALITRRQCRRTMWYRQTRCTKTRQMLFYPSKFYFLFFSLLSMCENFLLISHHFTSLRFTILFSSYSDQIHDSQFDYYSKR